MHEAPFRSTLTRVVSGKYLTSSSATALKSSLVTRHCHPMRKARFGLLSELVLVQPVKSLLDGLLDLLLRKKKKTFRSTRLLPNQTLLRRTTWGSGVAIISTVDRRILQVDVPMDHRETLYFGKLWHVEAHRWWLYLQKCFRQPFVKMRKVATLAPILLPYMPITSKSRRPVA